MNEQLISGYTAFTTADEFGATPGAEAPGSITLISFIGTAVVASIANHC